MDDYPNRYSNARRGNTIVYFLVFVIILLLVAAGGMVYYFSSQMKEMKQEVANVRKSAAQTRPVPQPAQTPPPAKKAPAKLATDDIATIVQVVMSQMQKNQVNTPPPSTPPPAATTPAPQPASPTTPTPTAPEQKTASNPSDDTTDDLLESMIDVLGDVDVDTVEETPLDLEPDLEKALGETTAATPPKKANDNFNKVVVTDSDADPLAQLGSEIDQLVQTETPAKTSDTGYETQMEQEVAERKNEMRTIVVQKGDTLISIAKKAYGDGRKYTKILRANPGIIKNPDRIFQGQVLRVPR